MIEEVIEAIGYVIGDLVGPMIRKVRRLIAYIRIPNSKPNIWFKNEWRSSHISAAVYDNNKPLELFFRLDCVVMVWFKEDKIYFNDTGHLMPLSAFIRNGDKSSRHFLKAPRMFDILKRNLKSWQDAEIEKFLLGKDA